MVVFPPEMLIPVGKKTLKKDSELQPILPNERRMFYMKYCKKSLKYQSKLNWALTGEIGTVISTVSCQNPVSFKDAVTKSQGKDSKHGRNLTSFSAGG